MLRTVLIATLIGAQGFFALPGGATLCLHGDGTYCLETLANCCCQQHEEVGGEDHYYCAAHESVCLLHANVGEAPCDCMHLAISGAPMLVGKFRRDDAAASDLLIGVSMVILVPQHAAPVDGSTRPSARDGGTSAALLFLAPVMLRC